MNIFRWLLCHLLSIILLISFAFAFYFWDDLKRDFTGQADGVSQAPLNELKQSSVEPIADTVEAEKIQEKSIPAEPVTSVVVKSQPVQQPQPEPQSQPQLQQSDPWQDVLEGVNKPVADMANPTTESTVESNFPPENYDPEFSGIVDNNSQATAAGRQESMPLLAGSSVQAENTAAAASDYIDALKEARRFYWEGKIGLAQKSYESLMFKYQDMPEAAAELGNMLLQQGNQNGATWAYKNAIPRYLNLHREQEAISIIKLLSQYDPAIAEKLQKKYW